MTYHAQASIPFWVKCEPCGHVWTAAYYPLPLNLFAKIGKSCVCPKCGEKKRVLVAKQDNGVLQESAA